ncbi:MAG: ribosome assembly cofactor RimP [Candidatus Cryptobacteroides sp.]
MNNSIIKDAMEASIVARGCFIVDILISKDNDIEIIIESESGVVTLDDCVELSRKFEECFDREKEDYSLTVSSAGLDQPFKVLKQYMKAVGSKVEVSFKGGKKTVAVLEEADLEGVRLKYTALEAVEGKKKKQRVEHDEIFGYDSITGMRPYIEF